MSGEEASRMSEVFALTLNCSNLMPVIPLTPNRRPEKRERCEAQQQEALYGWRLFG
jgi:hypothetical protein